MKTGVKIIASNTREAINVIDYVGIMAIFPNSYSKKHKIIVVVDESFVSADYTTYDEDTIDCGDNIGAFKSLIFLNDKDDYMQMFTDGKQFVRCEKMHNADKNFRKLNLEEIRKYYGI